MDYVGAEPLKFLDIPEAHTDPERARFVVLPVPYEATVCYRKGTRFGPDAIIRASHHVEFFDEEAQGEPWKEGIATLPAVDVRGEAPEVLGRIADVVEPFVRKGRIVFTIGGEHALSEGPVSAVARVHKSFSVLHVDAHADLRAEYEGTKHSHACAARRMMEHAKIVQVGIRSVSEDEVELCSSKRVKTFFAHRHRNMKTLIPKVLAALGRNVYVSFDLDGLDPSIMPGVGTPVPGGLGWYDALDLLRAVIQKKNVVAADVVELSPLPNENVSEYTAARLVYKMMAYFTMKGRKGK
ncbi:MAG: agmatinase [Planctomycetota bacterium]|jgi:agmatinase